MQHEIGEKRGPGRPRRTQGPSIVDQMAAALRLYQIDPGNPALIYRALWSAGLSYAEAIPHVDEAIAKALPGRH